MSRLLEHGWVTPCRMRGGGQTKVNSICQARINTNSQYWAVSPSCWLSLICNNSSAVGDKKLSHNIVAMFIFKPADTFQILFTLDSATCNNEEFFLFCPCILNFFWFKTIANITEKMFVFWPRSLTSAPNFLQDNF